jgi:hypothetical protein
MILLEIVFALLAFAAAIGVLVLGGVAVAAILLGDRPEAFLSDPAARRGLIGR